MRTAHKRNVHLHRTERVALGSRGRCTAGDPPAASQTLAGARGAFFENALYGRYTLGTPSVHLRYSAGTARYIGTARYSASHQARYSAVQSVQRTFPVHFDFSRSALIFAVSCKVALPVRVKIRGALRPANAPVIEDPLFIWAWFWRASACAARRFSVASRQKQPPPSAPFDPP